MPSVAEVQAIDFKQVNMKDFCTKQSYDGELTLEGCIQKDRNGCGGVGMQTWDQVEAYQRVYQGPAIITWDSAGRRKQKLKS